MLCSAHAGPELDRNAQQTAGKYTSELVRDLRLCALRAEAQNLSKALEVYSENIKVLLFRFPTLCTVRSSTELLEQTHKSQMCCHTNNLTKPGSSPQPKTSSGIGFRTQMAIT